VDIDPNTTWGYLFSLGVAFALAFPIGWDQERNERSLGFRTFPLIGLASCAFMLIARVTLESDDAASRAFQGLITGVGFLGGGAIVKQGPVVRGTATAAAVWATAALGAAAAYQKFEIAAAIAAITFFTLMVFRPVKRALASNDTGDDTDESGK
jgi:putative Mg2+ transporter-C (MgtC) family protein